MTSPLSYRLGACALAAAVSLAVTAVASDVVSPRVHDAMPTTTTSTAGQVRYIVRYRTGTLQRTSATQALATANAALTRSGLVTSHPGLSMRYLRRLANGADLVSVSRPLDSVDSATLVRTLSADASVLSVSPDRRFVHTGLVGPTMVPNDPQTIAYQWHFYNSVGGVYAPAAWDKANGAGVIVADLDTGVTDHPDLNANLLEGYDFISDSFVSRRPTNERVPGAHDYGDWNDDWAQCGVGNSSFHGTHTAGTIAEVANNGIGMAGLAHGAKILPVRVLGRCGGYMSDIADAIVWASGGSVPGVPANPNPAEVINMSLGGEGACDDVMQAAIDTAVANGTTVVVSAGNSNADTANFAPASCNNVINVGASRVTGGKAYYSNFGKRVDISAPGGGAGQDGVPNGYVWQTINDSMTAPEDGQPVYGGMAGTSMAAPHVSATVALLQSIAPRPLTPAEVEARLKATARAFPVAIPGTTPMGVGLLNAKAVIESVIPCQGADCEGNARPLANKVPAKGLSGAANVQLMYAINVPVNARNLSFLTYGGTGDVTLLVRYGQVPTTTAYDVGSARPGNNETARIPVARGGMYYVKVVGAKAFTGVTLEARFD